MENRSLDFCFKGDYRRLSMSKRAILDALATSGNWMFRADSKGKGYNGFQWAKIGKWTECPKWTPKPTCDAGGLFGQSPRGWGYAHPGDRLVFCETDPIQIPVDGNKVKTPRARILFVGNEALHALFFVCRDNFGGSLDLSGVTLPEGFTLGNVGGSLDLSGATLPKGFTLGNVGGSLYLHGVMLTEGFNLGKVVGKVFTRGCQRRELLFYDL